MVNLDTVKQFFLEARQELKKVTWPTKQQTITATWVVIAVTAALAIFLGLADLVFAKVIGYILK
ncbi:preprotein translocase subunit SecE [bacterium]|nr:MAG: preprotein translocase subunit SecE [bacterium]